MWQRVNVAWGDLITGGDWRRPGFIPDWLDPVLPLGALIAAYFALCAKLKPEIAMGHPGPRRRALLARHEAVRAKLVVAVAVAVAETSIATTPTPRQNNSAMHPTCTFSLVV
ncbi:hypothetical protein QJQ45_006752 [Haematococcus lacustris]|nr:hypothetical protein QJQ45_006752 [Haematococcus lacustris]